MNIKTHLAVSVEDNRTGVSLINEYPVYYTNSKEFIELFKSKKWSE